MTMKCLLFSIHNINIFIFLILSGFKWRMIFKMSIQMSIATGKRITADLILHAIRLQKGKNCLLLYNFMIKKIVLHLNIISLKSCTMAQRMDIWHLKLVLKVQNQVSSATSQCSNNMTMARKYGTWEHTFWINMF